MAIEPADWWVASTLAIGTVALLGATVAAVFGRSPFPRGRAAPEESGALWAMAVLALWLALSLLLGAAAALDGPGERYGPDASKWPVAIHLGIDGAAKVGALLALLLLRRVAGRTTPAGSPAPAGRAALAGVVAAFAVLPVLAATAWIQHLVYERLGRQPQPQRIVEEARAGSLESFAAVALFAVVAAPLFEEFVFRRLLHGGLRGRLGAAAAAAISAALFAAWHLELDAMPVLFVLGLALAALRERTGGLTAPIAMHACYNALQTVGILTARSGG